MEVSRTVAFGEAPTQMHTQTSSVPHDSHFMPKIHDRSFVDLEDLVQFIFPTSLQHPLSTGRLIAFGLYGPLDSDARLRAGHKGSHVVGRWELDSLCRQFEREDILKARRVPRK